MGKGVVLSCVLVVLGLALTCSVATVYTVGDSSGWDISTNLDTWVADKKFIVGDVLLFQYSSSQSVNEVTEENFKGCNTTDALLTGSNGNTSIPLNRPGEWYFVCGNKLYCLGGMKLQVNVQANPAASPAGAPEASGPGTSGSLPRPSSKNNNPSAAIPNSTGFINGGMVSLLSAFLGSMATLLWIL
ncbi:hypothetical protein PVL29_020791 [Vitis rotundifolia]|uniref:Phytocyanin domain-containing protein n=1 Tax=Vitis rotundifolia TaxID=103349 RepID=A0AA38YY25_VITRO|nr:hypothetical protein PVL29_020791 [Vitis rotundifolia]